MRRIRNEDRNSVFTAAGDGRPPSGRLVFVRGKSAAYLAVNTDGGGFAAFSGADQLRELALAILLEVPESKKQKALGQKKDPRR
jgi:hypothetical protein